MQCVLHRMQKEIKCQELYHVWTTAAAQVHLLIRSVIKKQQQCMLAWMSMLLFSWMRQKLQDLFLCFLRGVKIGWGASYFLERPPVTQLVS